MKKLILLFTLAFSFSLFAGEIVVQNFESGFSGKWGTNGNIGNTPDENHDNFSIVDNPGKDEINNSNKVGKFHRFQSGNWWAQAWFEFPEIELEASLATPKYLHISVYKPVASTVCIQLKDVIVAPTSNTGELKNDKQTKTNEWQDLVFKITSSGTFRVMEVKPDFVNQPIAERLDNDIDIYFDNIVINDDPTPLGEEPEPLPEFKGKLPEGFEGENTLLDAVFYGERFGTFGQTGALTDLTVAENPYPSGSSINKTNKCAKFIRKMDGNWWAGAFMIPLNQMVVDENNKYFHIMVYQEFEPSSLSLKLENSEDNTGDIILQGNEAGVYDWTDYVFEIPAEKYGTYDKIAFMPDFLEIPAPTERFFDNVEIYFDALELNNNPAPRTSGEVSAGLFTAQNANLKAWTDKSGNINVVVPEEGKCYVVQLYNTNGQLLKSQNTAQSANIITIPVSHSVGIYLVKIIDSEGKNYCVKVNI